jgi:hypothetical protein
VGLTAIEPLVGTEPTPLSMVADVAPVLPQARVLDCPGAIVARLAVKKAMAGMEEATIVTASGAVAVRPPPDAVTVAEKVPGAAEPVDEMARMALPLPGEGTSWGVNVPVTPAGSPLTERLTAALKPPLPAVVTFTLPWFPALMATDDGLAVMARAGLAVVEKLLARARASTDPRPVARS